MYVYSTSDLPTYLALAAHRRAWLDYWLYLHGNESSSLLAARPISPWFLADAILNASPTSDRAFLQSAESVLARLARLSQQSIPAVPTLPIIEKRNTVPRCSTCNRTYPSTVSIHADWIGWARATKDRGPHGYRTSLLKALAAYEADHDFASAAFATRRLSAELASEDWPPRALFTIVKKNVLDDGLAPHEALSGILSPQEPAKRFIVQVDFVEVPIPRKVATRQLPWPSWIDPKDPRSPAFIAVVDPDQAPNTRKYRLRGLRHLVEAHGIHQAAERGVTFAAAVASNLRVNDYVRTTLTGAVRVTPFDACADEAPVPVELPQPFWDGSSSLRAVPKLRPKILRDIDCRWSAALDHFSQALLTWAESPHSAASSAWQALEAIGVGPDSLDRRVATLSRLVARRELEHAAAKFNSFRLALSTHQDVTNWYFYDPASIDVVLWARRVIERSTRKASTWEPPAPIAWFHRTDGIVTNLWRASGDASEWLANRMRQDLKLLYAVRNALVHKGYKLGSRRTAEYLGRVGLECLVSIAEDAIAGSLR